MNKHDTQQLHHYLTSKHKEVKYLETHISHIFITPAYTYKIKKSVKTSFLDFSSLSLRKKYCFEELRLNQRLTKDVYLFVQALTKKGQQVSFEPNGEIVEYAVVMHTLPQDKLMSTLLEQNKVNKKHVEILAERVADFHKTADIVPGAFSTERYRNDFNDLRSIKEIIEKYLGSDGVDTIEEAIAYSCEHLQESQFLYKKRAEEGFFRDLHGDLHSGNIFLLPEPVIFDCIEFNKGFRTIDTLNEIAFLSMDLEAFGHWGLSKAFIDSYHSAFPSYDPKKEQHLLQYYKLYRACVRLKVILLGIEDTFPHKKFNRYYDLIQKYLNNTQPIF
ncbi:hypothetical protein RCC89_10270 [Cytophagaceae bacterium ABcell3]|nr:hypothetical protein RCC89_10270 [Cytophagaceae bacterium ABcell3]